MKYSLSYSHIYLILFILIIVFVSTGLEAGTTPKEKLKNITSKLRCMTCQNQTIYDSDAEFSLTIKDLIKEKLNNNESEKEIVDFIVNRYGEYILFEPKMSKQNIFLWIFPFIVLGISLVFLLIRIEKNTNK